MKILTSDLHHKHKRICELTNRTKETTPENHDDWLVEIWNRDVSNQCEVWHTGDLSFASKYDDIAKFVSKLNGNINLVKGNHDKTEFLNRLKADGLINNWWDYKEIKISDHSVCLFHFPIQSWYKQGYGSWHLHGHSHGNLKNPQGKILDVGLDNSYNLYGKHKFFTEEDIEIYMQSKSIVVTDHHKEISC